MFKIRWPDRVSQDWLIESFGKSPLAVLMNLEPKGLMKRAPFAKTVPQLDLSWPVLLPRHLRVGIHGDRTKESTELNILKRDKRTVPNSRRESNKRLLVHMPVCVYRFKRVLWRHKGFQMLNGFVSPKKKEKNNCCFQANISICFPPNKLLLVAIGDDTHKHIYSMHVHAAPDCIWLYFLQAERGSH